MGRFVISTLFAIAVAQPALAGAWLREKGTSFTALSVTAQRNDEGSHNVKSSLYAEWGLLQWMTVGLDATEKQDLTGHALVFARVPLADFGKAGRAAAEFGAGAYQRQMDWRAMYKTTLSYGKGFATGWGSAWVAVDATMEFRSGAENVRKLDLTAGLSSGRRLDPLLQVETSRIPGQPAYWSATPSIMIRSGKIKSVWVLGLEKNSLIQRPGLKLALWREF